jgi:hypothetical protein
MVRGLDTSTAPISVLLSPMASSVRTSSSRAVNRCGSVTCSAATLMSPAGVAYNRMLNQTLRPVCHRKLADSQPLPANARI